MSESTNNQTTGSQGNRGQQGNVAGVNQGVQNTYNVSVGETAQQRQIDRNICHKMLQQQIQLTSNTVLGRVYGNRNLIDEDLFVDLALVKPKRSQTEKHPQEIDPEKGSDLFTRQEETIEKRFAYREFLQEVISNRSEKQLAIIGEPGAGKTTLLQKLAFWLLQETDDLVIWVDLAELGNQPLGEYLEKKWLKEALGQSTEEIKADWEQKFKEGAVWLLLDGLDEMSQSDQQALNFRGWVMNAPIIVTCRLNLWQANPSQLQGFQTYLTQPFQDEQVQEFIRRWFRVEADAELLWSQLQAAGKERIKDLCRNPLRLTLLCATWKVEDALPETTAELYAGFVESMYAWKETAFAVTEEDKERLNEALGVLAKASLEAETGRFRLTHRLVCEHLGKLKAKGSLFPLALRLGWLNEVGVAAENRREKVYGFYHATFQEYFAALAVADWDYFLPKDHVDCPVEGKRYRIFEPQWKQVILLWLGREDVVDEEKEEFIRALVEFKDGVRDFYYYYQAFFLAAEGVSQHSDFESLMSIADLEFSLVDAIIQKLIAWALGSFDPNHQKWVDYLELIKTGARATLKFTKRDKVIFHMNQQIEMILYCEYVESFTGDAFEAEKEDLLCEFQEDTGLDDQTFNYVIFFIQWLQNYPEIGKVLICDFAYFLGEVDPGNPDARTSLLNVIASTENEDTRQKAINYLGKIGQGYAEEIVALLQVLKTTGNEETQQVVVETLGEIGQGDTEEIVALLQVLKTTENEETRWQVVFSLGKIAKDNPEAIAGLLQLLQTTENQDTQGRAIECLGRIAQGNLEAIAALLQLLKTRKNKWEQFFTALMLWIIDSGNPEAMTALVNSIATADDENVRVHLTTILLALIDPPGKSEYITVLINVITSTKNEDTRRRALEGLQEIGQENVEVIEMLINLIATTEDGITQWYAVMSLENIDPGNPEAIAVLSNRIATTENEDTLLYTAWSLGKIDPGNSEAIATLVNIIGSTQNEYNRRDAVEKLRVIGQGNPEATAALFNVVATTEDERTWGSAIWSLDKMLTTRQHFAGVVSALKHNLSDEVHENDFKRFEKCYKVIWNCAENLPYPDFYQAWHNSPTTLHPEITDQTPHNSETTFAPINLAQALQNQPILILNAQPLANETREGEIALTLCRLIWKQVCPQQMYPRVSTPADLCYAIDELKFTLNLPHRALLLTDCEHPTPELISFCEKLTGVIAIAVLTDDPLDAPLKGFPPNQPNLISAIETWLEEI